MTGTTQQQESIPEKRPAETVAVVDDTHTSKIQKIEKPSFQFKVMRYNESAVVPKRGSNGAAGYDISSCEDAVIPAHGKGLVDTGLKLAIPEGTYGRVAPRSGLAFKHFIDTGAGVIDSDYRGELKVLLFNHANEDFAVKKGDRIAQLILERCVTPEIEVVESLEETDRGAGGFGSTGVKAIQ